MSEFKWPPSGGTGGGSPYFIDPVANQASLPATAPNGTLVLVLDNGDGHPALYDRKAGAWELFIEPYADEQALVTHIADHTNPHAVTKAQVGLGNVDNTSDVNKPVSTATQTALNLKEDKSNKGIANGYAGLDSGGKVPVSQLPNSIMEYQGVYNATTNTPTLVDGTGNTGDVYRVSVAGAGVNSLNFVVGDYAVYNGTTWEKAHSGADAVQSVNGAAGTVTVNAINQLSGDVVSAAASGSQSKSTSIAAIVGYPINGVTGSDGTTPTKVVFQSSPTINTPTLVAPALGTPTSGVLTNATGLPLTTGVTGTLGSGNGGTGVTTGTGTGSNVLNNGPTLTTPAISNNVIFTEVSTQATPSVGLLRLYAKADDRFYSLDSNGFERKLSFDTGVFEKNYLSAGANNANNWTASGAGIAASTDSTATNFPDNVTQTTALKVLRASGTDYVYQRFTLDATDYSKKLKVQFDQLYTGAAGDYTVRVFSNTASAYNGTSTELSVAPSTSIPGTYTGQTQKTFDTPGSSAPYIEVRIYGNAGTTALYLNNFLVGPGQTYQGAAVGPIESVTTFTITGSTTNPTPGAGTTYFRTTERFGTYAKVRWEFNQSAAGSAGSGAYMLPMPTNLNIDATRLRSASTGSINATLDSTGVMRAGAVNLQAVGRYISGSQIAVDVFNSTIDEDTWGSGATGTLTNTVVQLTLEVLVPITEWAGSGTVNMGAGAQVEYASNNSTGVTTDSTSFVSGAAGALLPSGSAANSFLKRVRFTNPIQADDLLVLEIQNNGGAWVEVGNAGYSNGITDFQYQSSFTYGIGLVTASVNSTDVDVAFGRYSQPSGVTYAATGDNWSTLSNQRWRVRKVKASSPVGFGMAGLDGSSGLVAAGKVPGLTTGLAVSAGYIGETTSINRLRSNALGFTSAGSTNVGTTTSVTLTAGTWSISGFIVLSVTSATVASGSVSKTSGTLSATDTIGVPTNGEVRTQIGFASASAEIVLPIAAYTYTTSTSQTLYLVASANGTTPATYGSLQATRIA